MRAKSPDRHRNPSVIHRTGGSDDPLPVYRPRYPISNGFGIIPGLQLSVLNIGASLLILALTTASLVSVGLIIGAGMESPEGFQLVSSFLLFPTFFLSGALFPIGRLPPWLAYRRSHATSTGFCRRRRGYSSFLSVSPHSGRMLLGYPRRRWSRPMGSISLRRKCRV